MNKIYCTNDDSTGLLHENRDYWLPPKVLKAQLQDKLLIFCGAGISIKAGLPGFNKLVEEIAGEICYINPSKTEKNQYLHNNEVLKEFTELMQKREYDRAITYLEQYSQIRNINNFKDKINNYLVKRLFKKKNDYVDLSPHKNIIKLATSEDKVRLVTTNFDNLFELAAEQLTTDIDIKLYHAPLIPPNANRNNWSGIIKLHGSADLESNSDIVLSSGDFGRAYLMEGWARRFVLDMFREFHVVFIGYSLGDPILRYIVDAINTVRQSTEDDHSIKDAYIFLPEEDKKDILGILPIYYKKGNKHEELYKKLAEWLPFVADSRDLCKFVNNLKETISIKETISSKEWDKNLKKLKLCFDARPETIKYFCTDPIPSIEWLLYLEKDFITPYLTSLENKEKNEVGINYFSGWLTNNLGTYQVIDWLLENHANIIPSLFEAIKLVRIQENYSCKYDLIINTLLSISSNRLRSDKKIIQIQYIINKLKKSSSFSLELKLEILSLLKPQIVIKAKSLSNVIREYLQKDKNTRLEESDITEELVKETTSKIFDLSFVYDTYNTKELFQILNQDQFKTELANISSELVVLLKYTFDLLKHFNEANSNYHTYSSRDFIKTSNSNSSYDKYLILVDLTIDSLENLLTENPSKAYLLLQIMLSDGATEHPILFRIALYLIDEYKNLNINSKVELILPTMQYWLYEIECKREASNFIKNNWLKFSPEHQEKFWDEIRSKRDSINDNGKPPAISTNEICRRVLWIKNITEDVPIPEDMVQFLSRYKYHSKDDPWLYSDYQKLEVQYDGSYDKEIEYTEFVRYSVEEHIKLLNCLNNDGSFHQNNNSYKLWEKWGNNDYTKALEQLKEINKIKFYPKVWKNLIYGLTSVSSDTVEYVPILEELNCMSNNNVGSITNAVCWLLNQCSERLQLNNKDLFLAVFDKVLPYASKKQIYNKINPHTHTKPDWYHDAINHEIGYITQALIKFMISISHGKPGEISLSLTWHFNKLCEEVKDRDCSIYVKVILTSRLYALYVLLPEWTKTYVIPLLTWEEDGNTYNTEQFWDSYLSYAPHILKQLFQDIKIDLLQCLTQLKPSYTAARKNLIHILMALYLKKQVELEDFMPKLQKEDWKTPLEWLYLKLEISQDKKIIEEDYSLLKTIITKLQEVVSPLEKEVSYWIIMCLFSIPHTFYEKDWDNFWSKHVGYISNSLNLLTITTKILNMEEGFATYSLWKNQELILKILAQILQYKKNRPSVTDKYPIPNLDKILSKLKQRDNKLENNKDYITLMNIHTRTK